MQTISTSKICAGMYELWMVVRTRNGSILQHVKPFYSEYPSCKPVILKSIGGTTSSTSTGPTVYNNSDIFDYKWFTPKKPPKSINSTANSTGV